MTYNKINDRVIQQETKTKLQFKKLMKKILIAYFRAEAANDFFI